MGNAPHFDIDPAEFWRDPYPALARLRAEAPIAFVPQLGSTLFTRRDDIFVSEKIIDVFSSHQPSGLMNRLMGHNMMRKDGDAHWPSARRFSPPSRPRPSRPTGARSSRLMPTGCWTSSNRRGRADLVKAFALPLSAECLKSHHRPHQHALSGHGRLVAGHDRRHSELRRRPAGRSAMPRGYGGHRRGHRRHGSRAARKSPNPSLLSVMVEAGMPMDSVRANVKLAISGGQNEPRDAILRVHLGTADASRPARERVRAGEMRLAAGVRGIRALDLADRHVAAADRQGQVDQRHDLEPDDRVFFMFGSANRDEAHFADAERFDVTRDTSKSIAFGAGPHYLRRRMGLAGDGGRRGAAQRVRAARAPAPR